jgi:heat shock protein HtpX
MTTPPERPGSSGASRPSGAGTGGDNRPGGPAQPSGGRPSGGSRNRRRRGGGGGGSGGGGGQGQSAQGRSGGQARSGQTRSGQGAGKGAPGRGGSTSGGNRRPPGQGGNRQGSGTNGRTRSTGAVEAVEAVETAPAPARVDRTAELAEETAAAANRRKALLLTLVPGAVVGLVAAVVVAALGLPLVAVVVLVVVTPGVAAVVWATAPARVLASLGASPSSEVEHPRLHNLVDGLCATMGLDRPSIAVLPSDVPNAVALGRDPKTATLVVTAGLERSLGLVELEGVIAHELVHIKRNDTVLSAVAVVVALPLAFVRGTAAAAETVHGLVGRGREFSADRRAALVVRYPTGIGSALGTMAATPSTGTGWPPAPGRTAALTRWLWIDPMAGSASDDTVPGNLDDTRVRAAALALD